MTTTFGADVDEIIGQMPMPDTVPEMLGMGFLNPLVRRAADRVNDADPTLWPDMDEEDRVMLIVGIAAGVAETFDSLAKVGLSTDFIHRTMDAGR